jgi:hypothetical protein
MGCGELVLRTGVRSFSESDVSRADSSLARDRCASARCGASYHPIGFTNPTPPPSTRLIMLVEMFRFFLPCLGFGGTLSVMVGSLRGGFDLSSMGDGVST